MYLVDLGTYMTLPTSRIYHISDVLIRRQQSPIIRCTLRGLVKPGYEDEAFFLLQKFCEEATVLSISGKFYFFSNDLFWLVLATLKCHGLEYHLVNIWSLSEDFHKILASRDYLQAPAILAPFYLTTWIYPMHSKKGSETECVISNISELSGQKVIYIQQQSTKDFHENIAIQDKGRLFLRFFFCENFGQPIDS